MNKILLTLALGMALIEITVGQNYFKNDGGRPENEPVSYGNNFYKPGIDKPSCNDGPRHSDPCIGGRKMDIPSYKDEPSGKWVEDKPWHDKPHTRCREDKPYYGKPCHNEPAREMPFVKHSCFKPQDHESKIYRKASDDMPNRQMKTKNY